MAEQLANLQKKGADNYDTIPFVDVPAGTTPTFTTKGKAKAIWMSYIVGTTSRLIVRTNIDPSTGKIDNTQTWFADTNDMGNMTSSSSNNELKSIGKQRL